MIIGNVPNPEGSSPEKLFSERRDSRIERYIRDNLSENPTKDELLEVFRIYDSDTQDFFSRYNRTLEQWANIHTHGGGGIPQRLNVIIQALNEFGETSFIAINPGSNSPDLNILTDIPNGYGDYPTLYYFEESGFDFEEGFLFPSVGTISVSSYINSGDLESLYLDIDIVPVDSGINYPLVGIPLRADSMGLGNPYTRVDIPMVFSPEYPLEFSIQNTSESDIIVSELIFALQGVEVDQVNYSRFFPS